MPSAQNSATGARLIIVCGLPGSGKTTLAKQLQEQRGAILLSADEWIEALSIDLWDEPRRGQVEALQWRLGQDLLRLGLVVIIDWGTWGEIRAGCVATWRSDSGRCRRVASCHGTVGRTFRTHS